MGAASGKNKTTAPLKNHLKRHVEIYEVFEKKIIEEKERKEAKSGASNEYTENDGTESVRDKIFTRMSQQERTNLVQQTIPVSYTHLTLPTTPYV